MRGDKFRVGDIVVFRQWEDMRNEFGISWTGSIPCEFSFTKEMRYLCGREFIITGITPGGEIYGHNSLLSVSADMLRYVDLSKPLQLCDIDDIL